MRKLWRVQRAAYRARSPEQRAREAEAARIRRREVRLRRLMDADKIGSLSRTNKALNASLSRRRSADEDDGAADDSADEVDPPRSTVLRDFFSRATASDTRMRAITSMRTSAFEELVDAILPAFKGITSRGEVRQRRRRSLDCVDERAAAQLHLFLTLYWLRHYPTNHALEVIVDIDDR
jgi:hypothetical protein